MELLGLSAGWHYYGSQSDRARWPMKLKVCQRMRKCDVSIKPLESAKLPSKSHGPPQTLFHKLNDDLCGYNHHLQERSLAIDANLHNGSSRGCEKLCCTICRTSSCRSE